MDARYVNGATGLPQEGEPVEFVLDGPYGLFISLRGPKKRHALGNRGGAKLPCPDTVLSQTTPGTSAALTRGGC